MRYAILSDVHANVEALATVLAAADRERADAIVVLGDLVGYHADPAACIDLLRARGAIAIAGNHDRAAVGLDPHARFPEAGRRAIAWTRATLDAERLDYLARLPITRVVDRRFLMFHAALHPTPGVELHLGSPERVARSLEALRRGAFGVKIGFFGHTHRPIVHEQRGGAVRSLFATTVFLRPDAWYLVNPGSVGQPRDGDLRASFAIFDDEDASVRFHRVAFDRGACLAKAARAGLLADETPWERGVHRVSSFLDPLVTAVRRWV